MRRWDTVCSACASGFSVACMSSMGAALAAAGAAAGAGATSMAGMGSMQDTGSASLLLTRLFDAIGLGILNRVPNELAQPILVALLTTSVVMAYIAYRGHRKLYALIPSLASAILMYPSIYVWMFEPLYLSALVGLIAATILGLLVSRKGGKLTQV